MQTVVGSVDLPLPAEKAWAVIGDLNGMAKWHPAVKKSQIDAAKQVRTLETHDGGVIVEEEVSRGRLSYSYTITKSNLPVRDYTATVRLIERDDGRTCKMIWMASFEATAESAPNIIQSVIAGMEGLPAYFAKNI